jgi:hypothetical protein
MIGTAHDRQYCHCSILSLSHSTLDYDRVSMSPVSKTMSIDQQRTASQLSYDVFVVFVCCLRLDFVPLSVVLGALGSLRLLSTLTIQSVCHLCTCRL